MVVGRPALKRDAIKQMDRTNQSNRKAHRQTVRQTLVIIRSGYFENLVKKSASLRTVSRVVLYAITVSLFLVSRCECALCSNTWRNWRERRQSRSWGHKGYDVSSAKGQVMCLSAKLLYYLFTGEKIRIISDSEERKRKRKVNWSKVDTFLMFYFRCLMVYFSQWKSVFTSIIVLSVSC